MRYTNYHNQRNSKKERRKLLENWSIEGKQLCVRQGERGAVEVVLHLHKTKCEMNFFFKNSFFVVLCTQQWMRSRYYNTLHECYFNGKYQWNWVFFLQVLQCKSTTMHNFIAPVIISCLICWDLVKVMHSLICGQT